MQIQPPPSHQAYTIDQVAETVNLGKTTIYAEIKAGRLKVRKCNTRTLVLHADLQAWLDSLPQPEVVPTPNYADN